MDSFKTPLKCNKRLSSVVHIPPSPQMKKIGCGTGVAVYELQRSPIPGKFRSPWAVKKLIKSFKNRDYAELVNERVQSEAETLRKLDHPNIVGFRAFTKDKDGTNILAMEECSSSLGDLIECRLDYLGEVPYPPETILNVSHDIAKALDYLHNKMFLLHCDIKSFNILVKGEFVICKLCDFGVCLPLTKSGELDLTKTDEEVEYTGTPCWCAPEVLKCDQEITTKADIYSFGLVIWEMLALSPPIDDELVEENMTDVNIERKRPDLPDIDLGLEYNLVLEIYFCCTTFEKDKRPAAHDLVRVLHDSLQKNK